MSATYICECEHPKSQHKRERDGCRAVDCGCAKFEADLKASAAAQGVEQARVATGVAAVDERSGESTSARLRRVEAERDELREAFENLPCGDCWGLGLIPAEAFGRDADGAPERDEEAPCPEGCEIPAWLKAERNDAADDARQRDELAARLESASGDRDSFLAQRDQHINDLQLVRAELASARTELEKLRGAQADLLAGGPAPSGRVISVQQRYLCETCGGRYGKPFTDHPCGRLTPVVVTIARQLA